MSVQTPRDPWRAVWQVVTGDVLLAALLVASAAGLAIAAWLPQMPAADPVAYARWLSDAQAWFRGATAALQTLGLFTITRSLGFHTILALLTACLFLRLVERAGQLRQTRRLPLADLLSLLAHGGALLLLAGLLIGQLGGWRVEGLVVQEGERIALPGSEKWVALDVHGSRVRHSPGIVTFVETRGPGARVGATDDTGHSLGLQQSADVELVTELTVALTEDRYIAIPEAQLVLRLTPQPGHAVEPHGPMLAQVYQSPPGRLINETVVEGDAELAVGNVTLQFASMPYAQLTAVSNPGLWLTGAGVVLLMTGLLGGVAELAVRRSRPVVESEDA